MATTHGRDHVQDVELAGTKDGRITGLRCQRLGGHGRVPVDGGARHPHDPARADAVGAVPDPARCTRTSTASTRTRRRSRPTAAPGVPRPRSCSSGCWIGSRTRIGMDPGGGPAQEPHSAVRRRPRRGDRPQVRQRQLRRRRSTRRSQRVGLHRRSGRSRRGCAAKGRYLGHRRLAPTSRSAGSARRRSPAPSASRAASGRARSCASIRRGKVNVFIGAKPHGQGEETTFAQIVAVGARRRTSTTSRSSTATPIARRWAGAPTAAGRRRSAAPRWPSRSARSRTRRERSRRTCSRRRSRTSTTRTAASS